MAPAAADQLERAAREADARFAAVRDDSAGRYALAERFFDDPRATAARPYGRAELAFLEWEIRRGVLEPASADRPGSEWWRTVNAAVLRDATEAELIFDVDPSLQPRRACVAHWLNFLRHPDPVSFYVAHNASVVDGFLHAAPIAATESPAERTLMNMTLARVLFVQAMTSAPRLALGRIEPLGRVLGTPRGNMVSVVVRRPDLYPAHYELSDDDRRRVLDRCRTPEGLVTAFIDDVVLAPRLRQVYGAAAKAIAEPRLLRLLDAGRPSYPWGLPGITGAAHDHDDPWPRPRALARGLQRLLTPLLGRPSSREPS